MSTEIVREGPESAVASSEAGLPAVMAPSDLCWAIVHMRAGERVVINEALISAYQRASSPHSIRALKSDIEAFDAWCQHTNRIALPATAETVADYLDARAGSGSRPASLSRYKASIAKIHQLLDLKDPTPAAL
ncbi:site-specific integrase, partial [Sphingobium phenoxybenzoativorans]|uniref:site-specific integrase n=1 Tax=Sphingobium phenoxybenzoativorans TaxID=1592790 RepID=UPI0014961E9E